MSASWRSERMRDLVTRLARALAVPAALTLALIALAFARPSRAADSTRVVSGVHVGPGGVEINGEPTTEPSRAHGRRHRGAAVDITPGRVSVHGDSTDDDEDAQVDVRIPGIHVNEIGDHSSSRVRVFSDVRVAPGETVDGDVVAVFGSVTVEGHVTGGAVAVLGSVKLTPGATVDGDAVAVGGSLEHPDGSTVGGETVSVGYLPVSFGAPTVPMVLFMILFGLVLSLIFGWLLSLIFPERLQRIAATASRSGTASFFTGLVSLPLLCVATLLLAVTVIGIPVAFCLMLLYPLALWMGQLAASYLLGCRLLGRRAGEEKPFVPIAAGSAFVALFFVAGAVLGAPHGVPIRFVAFFFAMLGVLMLFGLTTIGTGALLLSRVGQKPRDGAPVRSATPPPAAAPPPAPSMQAPPAPTG